MNFMDIIMAKKMSGGSSSGEIADLIVKQGGDTLTWDGNTDGLVCAADVFYKVYDAIVSIADFDNGGRYTSYVMGQTGSVEFTADDVMELATGVVMLPDSGVWCVSDDGVGVDLGDGLVFKESGVYFMCTPVPMFITSLTIPGYTGFVTEELNAKYLPSVGNIPASWIAALKTAMGI